MKIEKEVLGYSFMSKGNTEVGKVSDFILDTTLWALPYLRVKEKAVLRSREILVPWECLAEFRLANECISTNLDEAVLKNAPEAPREEELSDSSVERAIRDDYQL